MRSAVRILFIGAVFMFTLLQDSTASTSAPSGSNGQSDNNSEHGKPPSLKVAKFDFDNVSGPMTIMLWILIASLAKLGFHLSHKLSSVVPESCLVILLGVVIGGIMEGIGIIDKVPNFSSHTFFLFMLPPIVLEAGYFLQDRAFFDNIGTILLYAVVGTLFNTFTVGLSLYGITGRINIDMSLMQALTFSSLIAAVDPVAVLAVFEEIHVNVMLYILVFGESLLNDAVTVVLYHLFESLSAFEEVTHKEILTGFASFFVVSLGGTFTGLLWGLATSFVTKYTDHVRVIEPIFVFVMSYLSYLTAELFHLSGIMSIVTCAIIMKPYVEQNISRKSHTTIKYFLKMMSSGSETLIFMFLGVRLVSKYHVWHTEFVLITLLYITIFRALGVIILTFLANRFGRLNKLGAVDQFIMSYGGIRGAVSFSLAILLSDEHFPMKNMLVTTTITVVMFTVFFQGVTIKPLVRILHVKLRGKEQLCMAAELNEKFLDHLVAGIEEISGHRGHGYYWAMIEHFHTHYLRRWLIRDVNEFVRDEDILLAYRRLAYKDALTHLEREGSGTVLFQNQSGLSVQLLARGAFEAAAVTSIEPTDEAGETQPMIRAGDTDVRVLDEIQRDWRAAGVSSEDDLEIHDQGHNDFSTLVARNRKTFRHRKFHRNNLLDDEDEFRGKGYLLPTYPRATAYSKQLVVDAKPRHHKHRPHHHKRHKHKKHYDDPPKKNLSTIFEDTGNGNGRHSPTFHEPGGATTSSEDDDDPGLTFHAIPRGRLGRFPSTDSTEVDNLRRESNADEQRPDNNIDEEDEGRKPTGDKESIPMDSTVVDMEAGATGETEQDKNAESTM